MPRGLPSPRARASRTRRLVVFLVVACVGLTAVAAPAVADAAGPVPGPGTLTPPDPYFPQLGNRGYQVEHYDLGLTYDPADRILHGDTKIDATTDRLLRRFDLDLTGMTVRRVDVDGKQAPFTRSGSELVVKPREPVAKGADFTVRVRYDGQPEAGEIAGLGAGNAWLETPDGAVTLNEPDGANHLFPGNDHPSDKATFTFRVTVPTGTTAVANGTLQRQTPSGASTTFVWNEIAPMATYLTQIAIGDLTIVDAGAVGSVKIRNAYAPNIRARAELAAAQTPDMLEFLTAQLGPFPFDTYGVLVPDGGPRGLAFEAQTFSLFAPDIFGDAETASVILAHELAHQWFGDSVSPATWQETWLNEGFATYFEWAWDEHKFNVPMASSAADAERAVAREPQTATDDPGLEGMFGTAPYERGALTLYALRRTVGDDVFTRILRVYLARYGGETASTADLIKVASDVAGEDLEPFFRTWLGPGPLPPLPPATTSV